MQEQARGRGRGANSPLEIPGRGWKDVLWRTFHEINEDRVTLIAAAVTYYLLLALFPAMTAFVSIYGLFTDPAEVGKHMQALNSFVPQGGMAIINDQLTRLTAQGSTSLSLALIVSLVIALWSASAGVKAMFEAMNIAYDEREGRNFFLLNGLALLFTLGAVIGAAAIIVVSIAIPVVLDFIGLGSGWEWLIRIASYLILALLMLTGIAVLYRWGASRQRAKWRWITPGAAFATLAIMIMSILFSWYAANFAHYDKTYGSLGGLIGLLTWLWLSVTVVIVGAELNSEAERQTRKDSTVGSSDPIGQRQAHAADTVGAPTDKGDAKGSPDRKRSRGIGAARPKASWGAVALAVPALIALDVLRRSSRQNSRR